MLTGVQMIRAACTVAVLLACAALLACGEESVDDSMICVPGSKQPCDCPGGLKGEQECVSEGKSWGTCGGCVGLEAGVDAGVDAPVAPDLDPGCASSVNPGDRTITIQFGGLDREFDLHVPQSYTGQTKVPLVLDFHGFTSTKLQQRLISGFYQKSNEVGFLVAYPNGTGLSRSWNAGDTCCGDAKNQGLDDVGLAKAIVAKVATMACVDLKRVYSTGISNGGMLSHRLACEAADTIAAVAPVAGRIDFFPMTKCQPSRPVPMIHFHGITDNVVPYDTSALPSFDYWSQQDGCTDSPQVTYTKGNSKCETHSACTAGVKTTLCTIDGGHLLYINTDQVSIANLAWDFLSQFSLP
jgi:polyhydroxybutyrate depolymerase